MRTPIGKDASSGVLSKGQKAGSNVWSKNAEKAAGNPNWTATSVRVVGKCGPENKMRLLHQNQSKSVQMAA